MSADLIIDSFAGGGGASTGIEMALGRSPDYAINHDAAALALAASNAIRARRQQPLAAMPTGRPMLRVVQ